VELGISRLLEYQPLSSQFFRCVESGCPYVLYAKFGVDVQSVGKLTLWLFRIVTVL
jgi:hypothetical protein